MTPESITGDMAKHGVPNHMRPMLYEYLVFGVYPADDFLLAVLRSDLLDAAGYADDVNRHALFSYASFLSSCAPNAAIRSQEAVTAWCALGGLVGKRPKDV